ncbi:hypothetical protein Mmar10_1923 [Maricaulis maris MCS10]|jgi:hypothetical protein|uniref:Uncharacterized protein n=2 Tax=Maricaulaceae TaxID=2800061 RepID=Q0ANC2_MARMM|nr:hypothetical protein Mmar10_1923 [Maricaulis maris MCS10]
MRKRARIGPGWKRESNLRTLFIYNSRLIWESDVGLAPEWRRTMRTLMIASSLLLAVTPMSLADSGNPTARASGESAGASVEATATLASAGVTVTGAAVVGVTGSTAGVLTGNPELVENSLDFAAEMAAAPFGSGPLEVTDAVIIADDAPQVPFNPDETP